jgi:hypothetical protein
MKLAVYKAGSANKLTVNLLAESEVEEAALRRARPYKVDVLREEGKLRIRKDERGSKAAVTRNGTYRNLSIPMPRGTPLVDFPRTPTEWVLEEGKTSLLIDLPKEVLSQLPAIERESEDFADDVSLVEEGDTSSDDIQAVLNAAIALRGRTDEPTDLSFQENQLISGIRMVNSLASSLELELCLEEGRLAAYRRTKIA